ncbi:hypothetical protein MMC18_007051 [Xylographa bjoerkii]|nr:hypothetical protein [Xylographa bjoerkii]
MLRATSGPIRRHSQSVVSKSKLRPREISTQAPNSDSSSERSKLGTFSVRFFVGNTIGLCAGIYGTHLAYSSPIRLDDSSYGPSLDWKGRAVKPIDVEDAAAWLRKEEKSQKGVEGSGVARWDSVRCASNSPCEDMLVDAQLPVPAIPYHEVVNGLSAKKWSFWGVFDGHAGSATSKILQIALVSYVARGLSQLYLSNASDLKAQATRKQESPLPAAVKASIRSSFCQLDNEIMFDGAEATTNAKSHTEALSRLAPGYAGSCALLAAYNTNDKNLYVACTGDSRAVLGRRDFRSGRFVPIPLSTDQTGYNESEVARVRAEHPGEPDVINVNTGRTLDKIALTRAFGDGLWKWPLQIIQECHEKFWWAAPLAKCNTPPYLTAEPVVTSTQVHGQEDFLIMASDGLWDHLSNEQAVELVSLWKAAFENGTIGRYEPSPSIMHRHACGLKEDWKAKSENFVVVDKNVATHLVRNALGGKDQDMLCGIVGAQPPLSREVRDDITVQVIFFDRIVQQS